MGYKYVSLEFVHQKIRTLNLGRDTKTQCGNENSRGVFTVQFSVVTVSGYVACESRNGQNMRSVPALLDATTLNSRSSNASSSSDYSIPTQVSLVVTNL